MTAPDPITFTFTFSEAIDPTTFTVATPTVTNGTKGTFNRTSSTGCTLQVVPPSGQGTITVTVAAGSFKDVAGNANAADVSVTQDYNVALPKPTLPVTFDDIGLDYATTGSVTTTIVTDPDAAVKNNKVAKLTVAANADGWPGTVLELKTAIPAKTSAIALKFYSPGPGHYVDLKLGDGASATTGDVVAKTTLAAGTWETLAFRFPPTTAALNQITIIPDFVPAGLSNSHAEETFYVDSISYPIDTPITFSTFANASDYVPASQLFPDNAPPVLAIVDDPHPATGAAPNKVLKISRTAGMQIWAGFYFLPTGGLPANTSIVSMRVYSAAPGTFYNVKLEGAGTDTGDVKVATTKTNEWETLVWDYNTVCVGNSKCLGSIPSPHHKLTVIPDHAASGDAVTGDYYIDDIKIFGMMPLDFENQVANDGSFSDPPATNPVAVRVQDPDHKGDNTVLLIRRFAGGTNWAGVYFGLTTGTVPANTTKVSMKVRSPGPGKKYVIKLENPGNTGDSTTKVATTQAEGQWETLVWDYTALCATGNPDCLATLPSAHSTVTIIPDFDGDGAGHSTDYDYYVDDIKVVP